MNELKKYSKQFIWSRDFKWRMRSQYCYWFHDKHIVEIPVYGESDAPPLFHGPICRKCELMLWLP